MGFQLEYESSVVFQHGVIYRFDECGGGYFSTTNGTIASPSYPENYPDNADCIYTIWQPTGTVIMLNFVSMDIEYDTTMLLSQFKYIGCLFMATNNTPCEIWGPILKQIT